LPGKKLYATCVYCMLSVKKIKSGNILRICQQRKGSVYYAKMRLTWKRLVDYYRRMDKNNRVMLSRQWHIRKQEILQRWKKKRSKRKFLKQGTNQFCPS
jgi:hypothetical protein